MHNNRVEATRRTARLTRDVRPENAGMKTNLIFIITDNQSPWTLGCYGNEDILTPNIDRLASEGIRFTNAFCSNPVCSPNRATLLTGLMPSQHGVHNWLGTEKPDAQMGSHAYCTIREFTTLPQVLADTGYDCGMSGKWHLGDSLHPQLGFGLLVCQTQRAYQEFLQQRGHLERGRLPGKQILSGRHHGPRG